MRINRQGLTDEQINQAIDEYTDRLADERHPSGPPLTEEERANLDRLCDELTKNAAEYPDKLLVDILRFKKE